MTQHHLRSRRNSPTLTLPLATEGTGAKKGAGGKNGVHAAVAGSFLFVVVLTYFTITQHAPTTRLHEEYAPSTCEKYIVEHSKELGFAEGNFGNEQPPKNNPISCKLWEDPSLTSDDCDLSSYSSNLSKYNLAVEKFKAIPDIFDSIKEGDYSICSSTKLHDKGLLGFFPKNQLSLTSNGYAEPLLPPMRSQKICNRKNWEHFPTLYKKKNPDMMRMDYLIHDFEAMCHKLKPTSRRVLIDLGASLSFHQGVTPILELLNLFEKFGFHFDHIYGFEVGFTEPGKVFEKLLPEKYLAAYHWINVGVSADPKGKLNPLNSILTQFNSDDFVVVKLDIDTPSIEMPLANQILENPTYQELIDLFYFEHHVHIGDFTNWSTGSAKDSITDTIEDTLNLFSSLREKGVSAHFWP